MTHLDQHVRISKSLHPHLHLWYLIQRCVYALSGFEFYFFSVLRSLDVLRLILYKFSLICSRNLLLTKAPPTLLATDNLAPHFVRIWANFKWVAFHLCICLYQFFENFIHTSETSYFGYIYSLSSNCSLDPFHTSLRTQLHVLTLSLLNKLNPICVAPILVTVGPKHYKPLSFVLNYPLELDRKTRLLKTPHAWRTLKNEMGIDIDRHAIRTGKLSKHWTVLCVLSGEKSKHQTYPAVTLTSYSNGCPGKTHPPVQSWHKCYSSNQPLSASVYIFTFNLNN